MYMLMVEPIESKRWNGITIPALLTTMTMQMKESSAGPGPWKMLMLAKQQRPKGRCVHFGANCFYLAENLCDMPFLESRKLLYSSEIFYHSGETLCSSREKIVSLPIFVSFLHALA